ncbi:Nn.00g073470.m01.CDS01 [Neocucurbitaria sp. VM-36]
MGRRSCEHKLPTGPSQILPAETVICPPCLFKYYVAEIKCVQSGLQERGGIFASKTKPPNTPSGSSRCISHQEWKRRWIVVKGSVNNDVQHLRKLRDKYPDLAERCGIDIALKIWEDAQEMCCRVPGYKYVEDEKSDDDVEKQSRGKVSIPKVSNLNTFDVHSIKDVEENQLGVADNQDGRTEIAEHPTFSSEAEASQLVFDEYLSTPNLAVREPSTLSPTSTPRSILKCGIRTPRNTTPQTPRSIAFKPLVTVHSQQGTATNNSTVSVLQPHNEHTDAEHHHRQAIYDRTTSSYKPGTWVSLEGYEKLDTSRYLLAWSIYEQEIYGIDGAKGVASEEKEERTEEEIEGVEEIEVLEGVSP